MSERGEYGRHIQIGQIIGAEPGQSSSPMKWIVGTLLVGGAILWAKHQSDQVKNLYDKTGLPHESFTESLREDVRAIPSAAKGAYQNIRRRLATKKEA